MTQTTTAPARFIPANGTLTTTIGTVTVSVMWVNGAGWKVQARRDGATITSELHQHEHQAVAAYNHLVAEHTLAPVEPAPAVRPVNAVPGNVGTQMRVSDPAHVILALAATDPDGIVHQGGNLGQATRTQLRSLAKKGYLELIYEQRTDARLVPIGGRITAQGRRRLAELTAADRALADYTARLQAALTFDNQTTTTIAA